MSATRVRAAMVIAILRMQFSLGGEAVIQTRPDRDHVATVTESFIPEEC